MSKTWGEIRKDVMDLGFKQSKSGDKEKENYINYCKDNFNNCF